MKWMFAKRQPGVDKDKLGARAEQAACEWLQEKGLKIVQRNYRCRFGELDIIAIDDEQLTFIEVRFRSNKHFGSPEESVDRRKQQKLAVTAADFLRRHPEFTELACRFDVIVASHHDKRGRFDFVWHTQAFTL